MLRVITKYAAVDTYFTVGFAIGVTENINKGTRHRSIKTKEAFCARYSPRVEDLTSREDLSDLCAFDPLPPAGSRSVPPLLFSVIDQDDCDGVQWTTVGSWE
jgi:hypothetical protein